MKKSDIIFEISAIFWMSKVDETILAIERNFGKYRFLADKLAKNRMERCHYMRTVTKNRKNRWFFWGIFSKIAPTSNGFDIIILFYIYFLILFIFIPLILFLKIIISFFIFIILILFNFKCFYFKILKIQFYPKKIATM